jgi:hypothetical protein
VYMCNVSEKENNKKMWEKYVKVKRCVKKNTENLKDFLVPFIVLRTNVRSLYQQKKCILYFLYFVCERYREAISLLCKWHT